MNIKDKPAPVLVVDDNPADQELVAVYLREAWRFEWAWELDFAKDGAEALAKLSRKHFTFVVLDWNLPVCGQGEVLRHLRQNGIRIPVVVISGNEREDIDADLDALQAAFLSKNQMNSDTFGLAITHSLKLLDLQSSHLNSPAPTISPTPAGSTAVP